MNAHTQTALLVCFCFVATGCAGVTREEAIAIAHREVARQHRVLPAKYSVDVEEGVFQSEIAPPEPLWEVTFSQRSPRGPQEIYTVMIDRRAGAVRIFSDPRDTVPIHF
jgi:hypothetical protein